VRNSSQVAELFRDGENPPAFTRGAPVFVKRPLGGQVARSPVVSRRRKPPGIHPGRASIYQKTSRRLSDAQLPGRQLSGDGENPRHSPGCASIYQKTSRRLSDAKLPGRQLSGDGENPRHSPGCASIYQKISRRLGDAKLPIGEYVGGIRFCVF